MEFRLILDMESLIKTTRECTNTETISECFFGKPVASGGLGFQAYNQ